MNLKLQFMNFHVKYFPENLGDYIEDQGERLYQDIKVMELQYQGKWEIHGEKDLVEIGSILW